jgi:hypothetical protein
MGAARRLFLYAVSFIGLAAVSIGVHDLLSLVFAQLLDAFGSSVVVGDGGDIRQQASFAIAVVVVGSPVWLITWRLAQQGARGNDRRALEERGSAARALYLSLVRAISALVFGITAVELGTSVLRALLGDDIETFGLPEAIASIVTAAIVWAYHTRIATADGRAGAHRLAAGSITRLYRYGFALAGMILALFGASTLIHEATLIVLGSPSIVPEPDWWHFPIAFAATAIVIGLAAWWIHWRESTSIVRDGLIVGDDERVTRLRATYFGVIVLLGVALPASAIASSIAELGRLLIGVPLNDGGSLAERVLVAPLSAAPFAIAAWLHVRSQAAEAATVGAEAEASARRVTNHLIAIVGLAFLTVGLGELAWMVLDQLLTGSVLGGDDAYIRAQTPWFVAQIIVGAALWMPAWIAIRRARAARPDIERRAGASRAYLYLVVGVTLISSVVAGVYVLYRAINAILGGEVGGAIGSDLAASLAVLLVAGPVAIYHGRMVVTDLRATAEPGDQAVGEAVTGSTGASSVRDPEQGLGPPAAMTLTLRGPVGTDLGAIAAGFRDTLPPGVTLEGV